MITVTVEQRLAQLEDTVRLLADEREITRLVTAYGPLVDSGDADAVAALWTPDGIYDVDGLFMHGRDDIVAMVRSDAHQGLIARGCTHLQGAVHVNVEGDEAIAASHSLLVIAGDKGFRVVRATAHHWKFVRTDAGWKVARRTSRALDGTPDAHRLLNHGVHGSDVGDRNVP
ncbi:nuclear transport factor 2 family protein [Gordonia amicalis]|uniref:nuclear transport factor 2 family protein n=1 Tax=Gordonia amicalis TaxID=89053 RepID=UPI0022B33DE7|nr:nuclear transport factor 2 family protein [Gordonia amicalis]MCZ4580091.1 nuclear transport factor 2 family protein [Gordonia amicalis]